MKSIAVTVQNASAAKVVPDSASMERWVKEALHDKLQFAEVCIRIVDQEEIQRLNFQYRHKDKTTNGFEENVAFRVMK